MLDAADSFCDCNTYLHVQYVSIQFDFHFSSASVGQLSRLENVLETGGNQLHSLFADRC